MNDDQNRGFEVGESGGVVDFFRQKLRPIGGAKNGKVKNGSNKDINSFIEQNSTSLWAKKDQNMHQNFAYQKPEKQ
jgi:hypothetical protein|tara:strand:+ start:1487 stop:1714 length:228 start_codon:yes stop_codon:yes gene_type:complete